MTEICNIFIAKGYDIKYLGSDLSDNRNNYICNTMNIPTHSEKHISKESTTNERNISGGLENIGRLIIPNASTTHVAQRHDSRRRSRAGRYGPTSNLCLATYNMNGGRSERKWVTIERDVLRSPEEVSILMVSETRLMNSETPPNLSGYSWIGSNRRGKSGRRSSGGVGILWATHVGDDVWSEKGKDWVAQAIQIEGEIWVFISIYVAQTTPSLNRRLFDAVTDVIRYRCIGRENLIVAGDFNAHLRQLDGYQNARGEMMLEFANQMNLTVLNMTNKCQGRYTRSVNNQKTSIDYVLCNQISLRKILVMHIDETQEKVCISDHNLIVVNFCTELKSRKNTTERVVRTDFKQVAENTAIQLRTELSTDSTPQHSLFKNVVHRQMAQCRKTITITQKQRCWSKEIAQRVKLRKAANRAWRTARRSGLFVKEAEAKYRETQRLVRERVEIELSTRDRRMYDYILRAPRQERSSRFWRYVRRNDRQVSRSVLCKDKEGNKVAGDGMREYLTDVAQETLDAQRVGEQCAGPLKMPAATGFSVTAFEIRYYISRLSAHSATGLDNIPTKVLKQLGETGEEYICGMFNSILDGTHEIPSDWGNGRVTMLQKTSSTPAVLYTYRPITVSTVLYRLFAKCLVSRMQKWIQENGILGEMQNGFRPGRRGEDNLFILTSAIELCRKQKKGLVCAFLDCSKAYDKVDRAKLWDILNALGMDRKWIKLIQLLYTENRIILRHNSTESHAMTTQEGLRQGCPLSPVLFALYIADLERRLLESGLGFEVKIKGNFWDVREKKSFNMPGLLFADDLVLMAHTGKDLQDLLSITSTFGDEMNLQFNPNKSAVVSFSHTVGLEDQLQVQGKLLPKESRYKYLGITLSDGANYLAEQEALWESQAQKVINQMHAKSLWSFNRFEITKIQWKATAVPKLTYGNSVTTTTRRLRYVLERSQQEAGRWALGVAGAKLAKEFIEGELGWSSFEAREARAKVEYIARIESMSDDRWPKAILNMSRILNIPLKSVTRKQQLQSKFKCDGIQMYLDQWGKPNLKRFKDQVTKAVNEVQDEQWKLQMQSKSSLEWYRAYKGERGTTEHLYDNSRGSGLLALARAGLLQTRQFRSKYDAELDPTCLKCGMKPETTWHIIMECNEDHYSHDVALKRLGLHPEAEPYGPKLAKKILQEWERTIPRTR